MENPAKRAEAAMDAYRSHFIGAGGRAARNVAHRFEATDNGEESVIGFRGPYLQALDVANWSTESWLSFSKEAGIHPLVRLAFEDIGFRRLYDFQERSVGTILDGEDTVITAATGRGKTEAWLIPILDYILNANQGKLDASGPDDVKAVLTYPTKALAQDQLKRLIQYLYRINAELPTNDRITVGIYDGDTPSNMSSRAEGYLNATFKYFECPGYNDALEKCQNCGKSVHVRNASQRYELEPEKKQCVDEVPLDFLRLTKNEILEEGVDILLTNPDTINLKLVNTNASDEHDAFVYEPEYNEYSNAPGTVIDNNLVFNQAEERQVLLTEQSLVSGRNINLNLLGGSLSRQGVLSRGVNVNPVSAPSQVITVTNSTDAPVEITLPTRLNEQRWTEALENERVENGGRIADVTYTEGEPYSELTLSMERGVGYDLRMSKVALGEREQRQTAHYIVNRGEHSRAVAAGTTERVYVEVRDRYNNPVSGVDVNTELQAPGGTDPGTLTPVQPRTDAEGVASFEYEATGDAPTVGATFSIGENATAVARERVSVAFDVIEDGGGGGDDGGGGIDQGTESNVFVSSVDRLSGGSSNEANVRFRNEGTDKQIDAAEFVFFYDSSNCPCADRLRLGNTGPVLEAAEGMRTLNQPVELPAGQTTVNFDFGSSGGGGGFSVRRGDFAVVRFEFSDGSRSTYFIQFQTN